MRTENGGNDQAVADHHENVYEAEDREGNKVLRLRPLNGLYQRVAYWRVHFAMDILLNSRFELRRFDELEMRAFMRVELFISGMKKYFSKKFFFQIFHKNFWKT